MAPFEPWTMRLPDEVADWLEERARLYHQGDVGAAARAVLEDAKRSEDFYEAWARTHPDETDPPPDPWAKLRAEARLKHRGEQPG